MSQLKPSYSYDAPSHFINFTSLDDEDTENVDSWFDEKANLENKFLGKNWARGFPQKIPLRKTNFQKAIVTPLRTVNNMYKEAEKENLVEQSISLNSRSFPKVKGTKTRSTPNQPQSSNSRKKPEEEEGGSAQQEKHESFPEKAKGRHNVPGRQKILKSTEEQESEKRMKMQQEVMERQKKNEEFKNLQTPVLQTKHHARPVTYKSAPEQEAEELEKLQQYKFKARELDPRILERGPILPKKPPAKPPTQPIGFDLEIEKRIQERRSKKKSKDEHFEFHSIPCPSKILKDVVGVPGKKVLPITVPRSPAFALKNRIRMPTKEVEEEELLLKNFLALPKRGRRVTRAQTVPHSGVPFKPQIPKARTVKMCPFSFDSRDKERQLQKEKKIKELQKGKEMPKFKALPVPCFYTVNLPEKKVKNATQTEPFSLETDKRGALKAQTWKHQLEEELKQQKEATCFKAQPNNITSREPFVPKKEKKNLSVQEPFQLATERRAKEWQKLKKKVAEAKAKKAQPLEEARQQKEELARIRKALVHKANPIRKYWGVKIKSSDQPQTVPVSPKYSNQFQC